MYVNCMTIAGGAAADPPGIVAGARVGMECGLYEAALAALGQLCHQRVWASDHDAEADIVLESSCTTATNDSWRRQPPSNLSGIPARALNRPCTQFVLISTWRVSGRNSRPITRLAAATTIGYQSPE